MAEAPAYGPEVCKAALSRALLTCKQREPG